MGEENDMPGVVAKQVSHKCTFDVRIERHSPRPQSMILEAVRLPYRRRRNTPCSNIDGRLGGIRFHRPLFDCRLPASAFATHHRDL